MKSLDEKPEVNRILGNDKFPLPNKKYGILPENIDILLNSKDYSTN